MRVTFLGGGLLAEVLADGARRRGCEIGGYGDLVFVAVEVADHRNLVDLNDFMTSTIANVSQDTPVIVTSQVPPGWTRPWSAKRPNIFYQPHTIIAGQESENAYAPDVLVVGCPDSHDILPQVYRDYLDLFDCPVIRMNYESAELSKLALNYVLAAQIEAATTLERTARNVGADWDDVETAIRADKRLGALAYVRPGIIGGHLPRDVSTVNRLRMVQ